MGTQVAITLDDQLKPSYAVSTVAAASFTIEPEELIVWIGASHGGGKHFEVTGIRQCLNHIREQGSPTPATDEQSFAKVLPPGFKYQVVGAFETSTSSTLTGTVSVVAGETLVTGVGTDFDAELNVGQSITIGAGTHVIASITPTTSTTLTGTVSITSGTDDLVGVGTAFDTELVVGQFLDVDGEIMEIDTITDAENIIFTANHTAGAAGVDLVLYTYDQLTLATAHVAGASGSAFTLITYPLETEVGVYYGELFQPTPGAGVTAHALRALEKYLESTQKAA